MNTLQSKERNFRNMVDDPYLYHASKLKKRNACGYNATGDEPAAPETPADASVKAKVRNITALGYAKTALALVGLYVIAKFVYDKWIKK